VVTVEQVRLIPIVVHLLFMQVEGVAASVRLPVHLARGVQAEAAMAEKQMLAQLLALQTLEAAAVETASTPALLYMAATVVLVL
jgi:hypothetical protein